MSAAARRAVLVTGAASGIGAALCRRLAAAGHGVAMHTRANREGLDAVAEECRALGADVHTALGDLAEEGAARRIVVNAVARFGGLDGLVSNAGFPDLTAFEAIDAARLERSLQAMPAAFLRLMQAAAPALRASPAARVVAVSSFVAHRFELGGNNFTASAAAKAALEALVRSLAQALARDGVTVNAVVPGYVRKDREAGEPIEAVSATRAGIAHVPMGRVGLPDEVAAAIEFLLAPDAAYITGQSLHVDGGMML